MGEADTEMKRFPVFLIFLIFVLSLLVVPITAMQLTFQNVDDVDSILCAGICGWSHNTAGGNSVLSIYPQSTYSSYAYNAAPEVTTYAAMTSISGGLVIRRCVFLDSSKAVIWTSSSLPNTNGRFEMNITGGVARIYLNGAQVATSTLLSVNPSYVGWGGTWQNTGAYWAIDDIVYGTNENKYIFGMPEQGFVIIEDTMGGAGSGLYYPNETTLVSSYNMTSTWGKGIDNTSTTIGLYNIEIQNFPKCTATAPAGYMSSSYPWPLTDCLFNNPNASYGYYYTTVYGSGALSDLIVYKGKGATVSLDKDFYSTGEPATGTWVIDNIPYWDIVNYNYEYRLVDLYGNIKYSIAISSQTGSAVYTWLATDAEGVYYAEVIAIPKAGGDEIPMGYDYATLSGTFSISGYVNEDESALPISGALVNFTQGDVHVNTISAADGSYSATGFSTGTVLWYNASATGYQSFNYSFTPRYSHTIPLNITLPKNIHAGTGVFAGGVARENTYGRPIANTLVPVENQTDKQYYTAYTNNAGWYNKSGLVYLNTYDIWGSKIGYANSTVYKKLMTGAL